MPRRRRPHHHSMHPPAVGRGTSQPAAANASTIPFALRSNSAAYSLTLSSGSARQAMPMRCMPMYWLKSMGAFTACRQAGRGQQAEHRCAALLHT
jgi:hypothetical protein